MKKGNEERLKELEKEIRRLTLDLLGPIAARVVVKKAYDRYFEILDEITEILKEEEYVPKSLMGIILYIYLTIEADSREAQFGSDLFNVRVIANGKTSELLGRDFLEKPI